MTSVILSTESPASQVQGSQQLQQAETWAAEVSQACKLKAREAEAGRGEAQAGGEQYPLQREKEFQAREAAAAAAAGSQWRGPRR